MPTSAEEAVRALRTQSADEDSEESSRATDAAIETLSATVEAKEAAFAAKVASIRAKIGTGVPATLLKAELDAVEAAMALFDTKVATFEAHNKVFNTYTASADKELERLGELMASGKFNVDLTNAEGAEALLAASEEQKTKVEQMMKHLDVLAKKVEKALEDVVGH